MLGIAAARKAKTNSVHAAQSRLAAMISARKAATETIVVGTTTAVWPTRSTRRDICGATSALVRAKVAETAPASQYSPWV